MITKLHLAPIICIIILLFADTSHSLTLDDVVDKVQERYEKTKNFQADFTQTSILKTVKHRQVSKGRVFIRKPGMMRWEYREPEGQLIVSDGKVIWFYIPADKQVMMSSAGSDKDSHAHTIFLSGSGKLRDTFQIDYEPDVAIDKDSDGKKRYIYLKLIPNKPQPNLTRLILGINKEDFKIEMSSVFDIYGNQTMVSFSNIEIKKDISENLFHFEIPDGIRVITQ